MSVKDVNFAVKELRKGKPIIVVDDEGRENEGDLVLAAEKADKKTLNFIIREARGLMCIPITEEKADQLNLHPMTQNTDKYQTPFTVSVDAKTVSTGVSVEDRMKTIKTILSDKTEPDSLLRPGHLFPLTARKGGVLERAGHTEASVDIMRIAGLKPVAVIAEIMKDDGSMARLPDLKKFSKKHSLAIVSVKDIISYRMETGSMVKRIASSPLQTEFGVFNAVSYTDLIYSHDYLALTKGNLSREKDVIVRVHSGCITGDIFHSMKCDCRQQLEYALKKISKSKAGVLLYIPSHEGRGIGLANKISAYGLQSKGKDTVEANTALGFSADLRTYGIGAQILKDLGLKSIKLLTNNPKKIVGLNAYGLKITKVIPVKIVPSKYNKRYLDSKKEKLFHNL